MARSLFSERARASRMIARRELRYTLFGIGVYLPIFLSFLISYFVLRNYMANIEAASLMVVPNPLNLPFYFSIIIASIYLALSSAISMAREKEQGTMEVLFYGPVDTTSYLMGKFIEHIGTYFIILAFYVAYFFLASLLTNFGFTFGFLKMAILSVTAVAATVSFGTLISTISAKVRTSVLLFLGLVALFLALQFLSAILGNVTPDNLSTFAAYVRSFVSTLLSVVQWASPFSYLTKGMEAVDQGSNARYLISLGSSVVYTIVLLVISGILFERRGVKKG